MKEVKLSSINTRANNHFEKKDTKSKTEGILNELGNLQNLLFAEGRHSLLIVIQGMDASGKDGVINNVFGKLNPQGVSVKSFKEPTTEELKHDFLWRIHPHAPAKGMIQIFNRSHYEDILITRVHGFCNPSTAKKRMSAINNWEALLSENNDTSILKFYLHISPEEQQIRIGERINNPSKMWKYNDKDLKEAKFWDQYMEVYEDCFHHCNQIPWIIIPSDQNWFKEYLIAKTTLDTLKGFKMKYPQLKK